MPIKYIFNGFFKSGTTLIWYIIKNSNKDYIVFYEPFRPKRYETLNAYKSKKINKKDLTNKIHKRVLLDEYFFFGESFLEEIKKQPTRYHLNDLNERNLLVYLHYFHKLEKKVILQTNRLFLYNQVISNEFEVPFFNIVRNPLDVYSSIKKHRKSAKRNLLISFLFSLSNSRKRLFNKNIFYFRLNELIDLFNKEKDFLSFDQIKKKKWNQFERFLYIWIVANYSLINDNIIMFSYEMLLKKPQKIKSLIESKTNLNFNYDGIIEEKSITEYNHYKIITSVKKVGLLNQYQEIIESLNKI